MSFTQKDVDILTRKMDEAMERARMELSIINGNSYGPRAPTKPFHYKDESGFGPTQDQHYWEYRRGFSTRSIF